MGQANLKPLDVLPLAQATLLMPILEEFEQKDESIDEAASLTAEEEDAFAEFEALNSATEASDSQS